MIINAVNTSPTSSSVAFKGASEDRKIWSIFIKKQGDALELGGIQEGTTIGVKSACTNDEAAEVLDRFVKEHNIGKNVTETVGNGAKKAAKAAETVGNTPALKKYGIPAAIALAAAVVAFFIGKSAERKQTAKIEDEGSSVVSNRQPQPVLQEVSKPDSNLEDFFSPSK
jgi:hypothetical protein